MAYLKPYIILIQWRKLNYIVYSRKKIIRYTNNSGIIVHIQANIGHADINKW